MEKAKETSKEKQRRKRRNAQQVRMDILDAMARMIEKEGFCQLNMCKVSKESQTDINAILRCFGSFDNLLKAFLYQLECCYNFRQKESLETDCQKEDYGSFLWQTVEDLRLDNFAQQALRWETANTDLLVNEFARNRENCDKQITERWKNVFDGSGLRIEVITALFVGGIRYIILNRKHSPMYGVNFATREGLAQLKDTLCQLADILTKQKEETDLKQKIAAKMKAKGLSQELIDECLQ